MTRRALGRGLNALLTSQNEEMEELREVDIDLIDPNPNQPRSYFPAEKLDELANSIKENGLVQPILLRRADGGRYQIVAGERRWRASQKIGLRRISAIIRQVETEKLLELALIENIQRQELNPIEEALAYQKLITELSITQEDISKRVGKDRSSIANYLRLLKLPKGIQQQIEAEQLTMGHARALLSLATAEQQQEVADKVIRQKLSVRETESLVKKIALENTNDFSTPVQNDANIRAAEVKLRRYLGVQVKIKLTSKGGTMHINFGSIEELDRIYAVILKKPPQIEE
jgi:ParB family transcriptional regulator, chromosome partitioning protein